jgi:hypothetical protein
MIGDIIGSVTAKINFPNGYSKKVTVSIEDNCCLEHANIAAENIIRLFVDNMIREEQKYDSKFTADYVILDIKN